MVDTNLLAAAMIYNKPADQITEEQRRVAKRIVFGAAYGRTEDAKFLAAKYIGSNEDGRKNTGS